MKIHLSLLGGSLLDIEIETGKQRTEVSFGFTGGPRCESVDIATDADPLTDKP